MNACAGYAANAYAYAKAAYKQKKFIIQTKLGVFLAKKKEMISLDIGSSAIKGVYGWVKDGSIRVLRTAIVDMPKGCYQGGIISDKYEFERALGSVIEKLQARTKDVAVAFESSEIIKRELVVPRAAPEDIADLVSYEITNYLPIDIANYVMQHKVVKTLEDGRLEVRVFAVPHNIASGLFDAIKNIGCNPYKMELSTNGLQQIFEGEFENTAVVDIGAGHTNVVIFENGLFEFNRLVSVGLRMFEAPLERLRSSNSDTLTSLLREHDVAQIWSDYRFGDLASREMTDEKRVAVEEIVVAMDYLLDEVDKVVQFHLKRDSERRIDSVRISGGGSLLGGMAAAIEKKLSIPASLLTIPNVGDIEEVQDFVNAITIMPGDMNFFAPFVKEKPKTDSRRLLATIAVVLAVFGIVYLTADVMLRENALRTEIAALDAQINDVALNAAIERVDEKQALLDRMQNTLEVLRAADIAHRLRNTVSDELIDLINAQIPDKVFLSDISISSDSVQLSGTSHDHNNISQFVYNLRKTGRFSEIDLGNISEDTYGYSFSVNLLLVPAVEEVTDENR